MRKKNKKTLKIILCSVLVILVPIVLGITLLLVFNREGYEPQENIYFLKYEGPITSMTTVIFKYDQIEDEVVEIGILPGYFYNCVINEEETCITGILSEGYLDESLSISLYDIKTGTVYTTEAIEKIKELVAGEIYWDNIFLYNGGNKMLLDYSDENEDRWWLFYDLTTKEYEKIAGDEEGASQFLAVEEHTIWYFIYKNHTVCQYNLEMQTKTEKMDSVDEVVFAPVTEQIAYKKSTFNKEIYLYDINTKDSKCIVPKRWAVTYQPLYYAYARWSSDGRQFFYIKVNQEFDLGSGYADVSLMFYDAENGRRYCFYKEKNITNEFQYVSRR